MSRLDPSRIKMIAHELEKEPGFSAILGHEVITAAVLDLRDALEAEANLRTLLTEALAEIDRLRALSASQEEALAWTIEKPKAEGWYWMEESHGEWVDLVRVRDFFDGEKYTGRFQWRNGYGWHDVTDKEANWAGPMVEPKPLADRGKM